MKTVYVVYKMVDGALKSDTFEIEGKINHLSIEKVVRDKLGYYNRSDLSKIISWQEEDTFSFEEEQEFLKNY